MANFLLIHGSQHGAWCWEDVVPLIADAGHGVHTIDLPGSGADETPRAEVNLTRYLQAVIDFVQARDLTDLVVVGHSLGGGTLTLLAPALFRQNPRTRISRCHRARPRTVAVRFRAGRATGVLPRGRGHISGWNLQG